MQERLPERALDVAQAAAATSRRSRAGALAWIVICASATVTKLWLVCAQTVNAVGPAAVDDHLFVSNAASVLRGEWFGPLTSATLVKGPVYPLWLALNHLTGMRLLLSQSILYAFASMVLVWSLSAIVRGRGRRALLFLFVLLNPATWADGPATRVIREGIYPSLSLLLLALAIGAALRLRHSPRASVLWAAAAGFVGALFAMTREEGVWLVPSLAIVALAPLARGRPLPWRSWLGAAAVSAIAFALPTVVIAGINWRYYGVLETCETRADYFTSAYGALTRVKTSSWNPHVPVSAEARAKVLSVSPAFQEIAPMLDKDAPVWISESCRALGICDDIAGGWFLWAFRAAVAKAGEYQNAERARAWYERLTREVDDACRSGRLDCLPARSSLMPPWRGDYVSPVAAAVGRGVLNVVTFSGVTPYPTLPEGDETDFAQFERLTNEYLPRTVLDLEGVVTSRAGEVVAVVVDQLGRSVPVSIRRGVTAPITSEGGGRSIRFSLSAPCTGNCALLLFVADGRSAVVPLSEHPTPKGDPAITWTTESARLTPLVPRAHSKEVRLAALAAIASAYALALPVLSLVAVIVLARRLVQATRALTTPDLALLGLALLVGIAARLLLLGLVDATSFPAMLVGYLSPAYALLVAFVALILAGDARHGATTSTQ